MSLSQTASLCLIYCLSVKGIFHLSGRFVSVTDNLYFWQTVYICLSVRGSVCLCRWYLFRSQLTYSIFLLQTLYGYDRKDVVVTYSHYCLSQTVYARHRQYVSVTNCLRLSQIVGLCYKQIVYVRHRLSVSVIASLFLSKFSSWLFWADILT